MDPPLLTGCTEENLQKMVANKAFSAAGSLNFDPHGRVIFFDALEWQLRNRPKTLTNLFYFSNIAAAYYYYPLMAVAAPMT